MEALAVGTLAAAFVVGLIVLLKRWEELGCMWAVIWTAVFLAGCVLWAWIVLEFMS